jgi:KDO2-lipid IV(A) lauroyltransferase
MINLKDTISDPRVMRLGMLVSQYTPERIGHQLSWWAASTISRLKPAVYRVVESNLGPVLETLGSHQPLDQTARKVFYLGLRSYFDLFRALRLPEDKLASLVEIPETTREIARSLWNRDKGTVLVFPHLGNFDLGGHAILRLLPEMQLFTLPDPPPGFKILNESRSRGGVKVTPLSTNALRDAIKLLRRGGVVSIAADRPVSALDEPVSFFGRPARVPSGHIRLALKTGASVVLGYCVLSPETQRYSMHLEPPMEMTRTGNRDEDLRLNMQRVLSGLESIIRSWPEQWQMFVPVWPDLKAV